MEEAELCFPQLNTSCRTLQRPQSEVIVTVVALSSISLLTAILNLLVIISISHFRQLHTPTNLLLLSLAVSDFLVGLFLIFQIMLIDGCWFLGDIMCTLYQYLAYIVTSASIGTMVVISMDRYVAICHPLHYSTKVTQKRVKICVYVCWICSVVFQSLILKDNLKEPGKFNSCLGECAFVINYIAGYIDMIFSFLLPITVIVVLYLRVFVVAVSQARAMRSHIAATHLQSSVTVNKSELKAARTLGIVVLVFLLCMCPFYCVALSGQDSSLNASSATFVICLVYFNSCLNPIIYVFFYPWFRKSIKLILTLQILKPNSSDISMIQRVVGVQQLLLPVTMEEAELCFPQLNTSCRRLQYPESKLIMTYVALSSISLGTAALNLLVIISISHFRQLQTPTNLLLLSLAVSDFLIGLILFFYQIVLMDGCWFLSDIMCTLYQYLSYIVTSASVGTMVIISMDRYVAICHPLHYSTKVTQKRVEICVCVCWICSVVFQSLILKDNLKQPDKFDYCLGECVLTVNYIAGYVDMIFSFIVPIAVVVVLYLRVFVVAVSQARAMRSHIAATHLQSSVTVNKSELKAARTLGIVVVVFLVCLCPYYCVALSGQDSSLSTESASFVIYLFFFNSCLNPIIYVFFYPWFRKSIKLIVTLQILKPDSCDFNLM
ncbi:uncharacterized protein ACNS7B_024484 [Menidia menidia]